MNLREKIAAEIRDNISVTLHNTGDEYADYEIDNFDDLADRILAIPELREALAYMAAVDSAHPVFGEIREMLNRTNAPPPTAR
jgi:hypothetical protein